MFKQQVQSKSKRIMLAYQQTLHKTMLQMQHCLPLLVPIRLQTHQQKLMTRLGLQPLLHILPGVPHPHHPGVQVAQVVIAVSSVGQWHHLWLILRLMQKLRVQSQARHMLRSSLQVIMTVEQHSFQQLWNHISKPLFQLIET